MRVCDLIAQFIYAQQVDTLFLVTGGGNMFLTDGVARNRELRYVCCHHEQAAAMAAVGYAKYKGFGCAMVTTGCGGTNAMTAVLNAWQDSTPCLFVSGQCKRKETIRFVGSHMRQVGVQEADIVTLVSPITKYAVMIDDPNDILFHLEKAVYLAKNGRPGPVWIDVPLDVQAAAIEPETLRHFSPAVLYKEKTTATATELREIERDLMNAERPVIIAGHGIRLAGATDLFYDFVYRYHIPVVYSMLGTDAMPNADDLCIGAIGNKGSRAGNFAMQNADYILALGSRLSVSSTGQTYEHFAREAKVAVVDIDKYEHTKNTVHIEQLVIADVKDVLSRLELPEALDFSGWADKCLSWKKRWPVCLPEYDDDSQGINIFKFLDTLSDVLKDDSVVIGDAGSAVFTPFRGLRMTGRAQRYVTSGGQAEMGFSLPAAIGVSAARGRGEVFAVTGDGSLQMNIQEFQTLKGYQFPVKLFVWNNNGYMGIRATQRNHCGGMLIGTGPESGLTFPDLEKLAAAYGLRYVRISRVADMKAQLEQIACWDEPVICEVMCIEDQILFPSISSHLNSDGQMVSLPPEDMAPFLSREELREQMVVPLSEASLS